MGQSFSDLRQIEREEVEYHLLLDQHLSRRSSSLPDDDTLTSLELGRSDLPAIPEVIVSKNSGSSASDIHASPTDASSDHDDISHQDIHSIHATDGSTTSSQPTAAEQIRNNARARQSGAGSGLWTPPPSATVLPDGFAAVERRGILRKHRPPSLNLTPQRVTDPRGADHPQANARNHGTTGRVLFTDDISDLSATPLPMSARSQNSLFPPIVLPRMVGRGRVQTYDSRYQMYPDLAYAAGLSTRPLTRYRGDMKREWSPDWQVYPMKTYRRNFYVVVKVQSKWDDELLLKELKRTYDRLRKPWRKYLSLQSVYSIARVWADDDCIYPQQVGRTGLDPAKNMRMRYLLDHPDQMRGRHEFMAALTESADYGIEFVERFQVKRVAIAVFLMIIPSLVTAIVYSIMTGDVSTAFTIAGFMTSSYSVCLVLVGLVNLEAFY